MKKVAFLSCDDLTDYVVDDDLVYDKLRLKHPEFKFDVVSWSDDKIKWSDYEFAILRTTWDYTKNITKFLEQLKRIEEAGCLIYNPLSTIKWNCYKTYLKELSEKKIPIIESFFIEFTTLQELEKHLQDEKKYVIKPVVGASADHIKILLKADMLKLVNEINQKGPSETKKWFIQPFIEEVLQGECSMFFLNSKFSHAVKKVPKDGDFRVQEEHGGIITSYQPIESEHKFANDVIKAIGQNLLYARVDFLNTQAGPKLIELELIEPSFYFRTNLESVDLYIKAVLSL